MSLARAAVVRLYLDADVLGLAHVVAALRNDATYPGDPSAIIKRRERPAWPIVDPATEDDVWIPEVASRGWLIITRDSRIRRQRLPLCQDAGWELGSTFPVEPGVWLLRGAGIGLFAGTLDCSDV